MTGELVKRLREISAGLDKSGGAFAHISEDAAEGLYIAASTNREAANTIETQAKQIADLTDERDDYAQAARAEASERERAHKQIEELVGALTAARKTMLNCVGHIKNDQIVDKKTDMVLTNGFREIDTILCTQAVRELENE